MPSISWFRPSSPPQCPLPEGITRQIISSPNGPLELLVAEPADPSAKRRTPIFFAHGGCGGAGVWREFMTHFSQLNIPCYAVSYRGHGGSWYPTFIRMFFYTKRAFGDDLVTAVKKVEEIEKEKTGQKTQVVLVGHSAGGALSQYVLSSGDITVKGVALLGAIPGYGAFGVNSNWLKADPWFMLRFYFYHFGHPMSPLSSTKLVKNVFFCDAYPYERVQEFETLMPRYESWFWPMSYMWRFVDFRKMLQHVTGGPHDRVAVIAAQFDRLVSPDLAKRNAVELRQAARELAAEKKLVLPQGDENVGIRYDEVVGAGHHLQNDLQWEDSAEKLHSFYEQLF